MTKCWALVLRVYVVAMFFRFRLCQLIPNISIPNYLDVYKPIDYAVIGQQKSGTSTLWNILTSNPHIKWISYSKELFWFNGEVPKTTLCDNHLEEYLWHTAVQRLKTDTNNTRMGDWSATYFSCLCCPVALKQVNPGLKILVVLRDPVQRVLSRFLEQKRSSKLPFHSQVANFTFAEYTTIQLDLLEACKARATAFRPWLDARAASGGVGSTAATSGGNGDGAEDGRTVGWGAGINLVQWMELQCFARNNMYGWSVYDAFLENYLAHFPPEQILVLYTEELASRPLETVKKAEAFLGAQPYEYDPMRLSLVFNSRECYSWRCAKKAGEIRPLEKLGSGVSQDGPFTQTLARLRAFYRPHMQRLIRWGVEGRIAPPPDSWKAIYG